MARLDETPIAFDPLDEAYALAPPTVDGTSLRESFSPSAAASADTIPLSDAPLPTLGRSSPAGHHTGDEGRGRSVAARSSDPTRFTLRNLLMVITLASVILAIGVRFPRPVFAGAVGLAALVTAVSASWLNRGGAAWQLAWWTLLGIYLMACGFAMLGM
jgi:hypothetical protein